MGRVQKRRHGGKGAREEAGIAPRGHTTGVGERASEPILAHIFLSPPRSVFPRSVSSAVFLASYEQACAPRARWLLRLPSRSLHATLPLSTPLVRHRHLIQTLFTAEGGVFTITMRSPDGRRTRTIPCVRLRPAHLFLFERHPSRRVYNKHSNFEI